MLKRLGFKASLPALFPGGRKNASDVASNFPFANGGEGLKSRCYGGVNNSPTSYSERISNTEPLRKLRTAMASSSQACAFPRHEVGVVENLKRSPLGSVGDYDDFAELGPSVLGGADSGFDLAKDERMDTNPPGMLKNGTQQAKRTSQMQEFPEKLPSMTIPPTQDKRDPGIHSNVEGRNGVLRTNIDAGKQKYTAENNQCHTSPPSILVDNIPPNISPQDLRVAVSAYGEILSASMRTRQDGLSSYLVKFKSVESKERAVAAQWITVKSSRLPVRHFHISGDITVRITNISMETAEPAIHSMCMSYGYVTGLARTKEGAVDVVFRVKNNLIPQSIVKHLNDVFIDDCRWSAQLLPKLDHNSRTDASGSAWPVGSQISNLLGSFRKQFQMQRIYLEDLENLHHAVLHLRDLPPDLLHHS